MPDVDRTDHFGQLFFIGPKGRGGYEPFRNVDPPRKLIETGDHAFKIGRIFQQCPCFWFLTDRIPRLQHFQILMLILNMRFDQTEHA
jgi:hypothetical protein